MIQRSEIGRRRFMSNLLGTIGLIATGPVITKCGGAELSRPKMGVPLYRPSSDKYDTGKVVAFFEKDELISSLDEDIARFVNEVYRTCLGKEMSQTLTIAFTGKENQQAGYCGLYYDDIDEIVISSLHPCLSYTAMSHEIGHSFDNHYRNRQYEYVSILHEYMTPIFSIIRLPELATTYIINTTMDRINYRVNEYGYETKQHIKGNELVLEFVNACEGDFVEAEKLIENAPLEYLEEKAERLVNEDYLKREYRTFTFFENIIKNQLSKLVKDPANADNIFLYNSAIDKVIDGVRRLFPGRHENFDFEQCKIPRPE